MADYYLTPEGRVVGKVTMPQENLWATRPMPKRLTIRWEPDRTTIDAGTLTVCVTDNHDRYMAQREFIFADVELDYLPDAAKAVVEAWLWGPNEVDAVRAPQVIQNEARRHRRKLGR